MSKERFIEEIVSAAGDHRAAASVWDTIVEFGFDASYSPYPDDALHHTFGIAEEELEEDLIIRTCHQVGRQIPTQAIVDEVGRIDTLRQVVQLVSRCPQR
jgi:hypothetical protein